MHRKRIIVIGGIVFAAAIGLALAGHAVMRAPAAQSRAATRAPQEIPVVAGSAETRNVPVYVEGLGTVQAFNTVAVKTRVDGQITAVLFNEGQDV
jgi:membrane fusion protein, multidrug efflux system